MEKDSQYWKSAIEKAEESLAELHAERDHHAVAIERIDAQILQWEQILSGLKNLTAVKTSEPEPAVNIRGIAGYSLADAIRLTLQASQVHHTARGIRDILEASDYDLTQHNNPLASIHGVLKRLVESGDVITLDAQGKAFYRTTKLKPSKAARVDNIIKNVTGKTFEEVQGKKR